MTKEQPEKRPEAPTSLLTIYFISSFVLLNIFNARKSVTRCLFLISFLQDFTYLILDRGERRKKELEKHQCVVASHAPPAPSRDLPRNPGMCPDWESN